MKCPKCKTELREVSEASSSSQLTRGSGSMPMMISGFSCWCCGTWVEKGEVVQQYDHVPDTGINKAAKEIISIKVGAKKLSGYDHVVWNNRDEIEAMLAREEDFRAVCAFVVRTGKDLDFKERNIRASIDRLQSGRLGKMMAVNDA
jgi:hypothetical protein